jgi:hypothetical protein
MAFTSDQLSNTISIAYQYIENKAPILFKMSAPLLDKMMERKEFAEGTRLQFPLNFNKMQNISYITGTTADVIDTNTQQNLTYAQLDWKMYDSVFSVTLKELVEASGKNAVIDIITAKAENTLESLQLFIHQGLFGSATSNPLAFNGFQDIFAASGTAYAGLTDTDFGNDAAGDNLWLPQLDTSTTAISYTNIEPMINRLKAKGGGSPDYMISDSGVYSKFKSTQQSNQRFVDAADLTAGFPGIIVDGIIWYADDLTPNTSSTARTLYIVKSDTMSFKYKYGFDKASPMDDDHCVIPNQPVIVKKKFFAANIACNNRRLNGAFKALNPSA